MLIMQEALKKALLKALADEQSSKILACAVWKAKSVMDLIREAGIPHTSAYRLVNELKESGLLVVERMMLSEDGKKYALYKGTFKSIMVKFEGSSIEVDAIPNRDVTDKAFRLFYSLTGRREVE
jgi:hypothetical protein